MIRDEVVVPVKTPLESKINWVQIGIILVSLASAFGFDLGPETGRIVEVGVPMIGAAITIILRTWFSTSVITGSVK